MSITKKELGELVKQARKIKSKKINIRYTQKMLANDIGKSQSYIGDIESGRTYPSFVILTLIAETCGLSVNYFIDGKNIDKDIDEFIKLQVDDLQGEDVSEIREELKNDPDIKINYIYDYINKDSTDMINEPCEEYRSSSFKAPEEIINYVLKQPIIMEFCEVNTNELSNEEMVDFTNNLLRQLKLISYKYKK